jgi:hypothetical protein
MYVVSDATATGTMVRVYSRVLPWYTCTLCDFDKQVPLPPRARRHVRRELRRVQHGTAGRPGVQVRASVLREAHAARGDLELGVRSGSVILHSFTPYMHVPTWYDLGRLTQWQESD